MSSLSKICFNLFADVIRHLKDVLVARNKISEPDSHQTDEAEVGPIQIVPALPVGEQNCSHENVSKKYEEARCHRNSNLAKRIYSKVDKCSPKLFRWRTQNPI